MKLFDFTTPEEWRQEIRNWLDRDSEEVYVYFPRYCQDDTIRAFETLRRETTASHGRDSYETSHAFDVSVISNDNLVKSVSKTYNYYPIDG